MDKKRALYYADLLHSEISPALGCTEPAAAALATAYAANQLEGAVTSIQVAVSPYIFKNGMNVGIPGTGMIGLDIAAALGGISAAPEKSLMVLNDLSIEQKEWAKVLVAEKKVCISLAETDQRIYISATATDGNHTATATISGSHTNLTKLTKNGMVLQEKMTKESENQQELAAPDDYTVSVAEILSFVDCVSLEELSFLQEVLDLNIQMSKEGLEHDYGLKVGKSIMGKSGDVLLSSGVVNYAVACTAAAADARMAGCDKPVMSAAGSGNQGLTASIPVAAVSEKMFVSKERTLRALALSILITVHTKHYIGRLSVLCGCSISAAIGACCGIIYLLNGTYDKMVFGINTMVADISGVICDGAKPGCALKIATAVSSALRAATMALNGVGADCHDGIVATDAESTLKNLGTLGNEGMADTNTSILSMMLQNQAGGTP